MVLTLDSEITPLFFLPKMIKERLLQLVKESLVLLPESLRILAIELLLIWQKKLCNFGSCFGIFVWVSGFDI
jgi:hypothetical protein